MLTSANSRVQSNCSYKQQRRDLKVKQLVGSTVSCTVGLLFSFIFFARWEQDTLRSVTSVGVTGRRKPVRAIQMSIRVTGPCACGWCVMGPNHEPQQHHVQVLADDAHFRHANTTCQESHETISLPHFRTYLWHRQTTSPRAGGNTPYL